MALPVIKFVLSFANEPNDSTFSPYYEMPRGQITFLAFTTIEKATACMEARNVNGAEKLAAVAINYAQVLAGYFAKLQLGANAAICIDPSGESIGGSTMTLDEFIRATLAWTTAPAGSEGRGRRRRRTAKRPGQFRR